MKLLELSALTLIVSDVFFAVELASIFLLGSMAANWPWQWDGEKPPRTTLKSINPILSPFLFFWSLAAGQWEGAKDQLIVSPADKKSISLILGSGSVGGCQGSTGCEFLKYKRSVSLILGSGAVGGCQGSTGCESFR